MASVKTRFCPSPTGFLHLGNVRTALFSALFAIQAKGTLLLRIEDTDKTRSDERFTDALMQDLKWLDVHWQEGPVYQSKRQAIYDQHYQTLVDKKLAYPCFCSEEQLILQRKLQQQQNKPPRYVGTCRGLTKAQIKEKTDAGIKPTLRFHIADDAVITFHDRVRGEQTFRGSDLGDFIIRRADGTSPFMFSNAIDDAMMGVTHVLRGEDHLTNTPRQIAILKALDLPLPIYGHIALIVGSDGSPLSKRHGSRSLQTMREEGFLPMAIVNYLARLGHYFGHDNFLTIAALAKQFNTASLAKSPAKFNEQQLLFWQTQAVMHLDNQGFWSWVGDAIQHLVPANKQAAFVDLIKPNVQFPREVKSWAQALFSELPLLTSEQEAVLNNAGNDYFQSAVIALEKYGADANKITTHIKESVNVKGKALFLPLRIALTAHEHGPDFAALLAMMDVKTIKRRLERGM